MIKAIIFDLGGVVLKHRATLVAEIISKIFSVSKKKGLELWSQYRVRLLKGKLSMQQLLRELNNEFKTKYTLNELSNLEEVFYRENTEIDYELLKFIEKLKTKHRVYLMTDTIDVHDEYNKKRNIYNKFTQVFKSFEEELTKAEGKEFFVHVLKKIKTRAEECVFIDDLEEQIEAAESLGMKGIIYKNVSQLKEELYKLNILI